MKKMLALLCLFCLISPVFAQNFSFSLDQNIKVNINGVDLAYPWTGGFNSAQISTIDLNGDNQQDVVIFDRTNYKISTFLNQNGKLVYAPDYEWAFPAMENWCLLIDYDSDGRKDLFTATRAGIRVYRNVTQQGQNLTFRLFKDALSVKSTTGNILRLLPDLTDIPAIADIDNDGDIDVLNFIPLTGQSIEWSRNFSMERYNRPDSLEFEKVTLQWGGLYECSNCNEYFFGTVNCKIEQVEHSGHAMTILDLNGDNVKDFLLSDVNCTGVAAFINKGTPTNPIFDSFIANFPPDLPVNIVSFPATFYEDADGDGIKDLLVSPNQFFNDGNRIDFTNSIWLYKNIGTNNRPDFIFQKNNFLQDQTIDLGEFARPVFADYDADGDLDLFVSNGGQAINGAPFRAKIFLFENVGSQENPSFRLVSDDYANFSQLGLRFLKITLADLNADGSLDLAFTAVSNANSQTSLRYVLNTAPSNQRFNFNINNVLSINLPNLLPFDEPLFLDIDGDGDQDLLLARFQGGLFLFENMGNLTFSLRNQSVGGIADDFNKRALSIAIADFNKNNKPDLITGDRSGRLNIYIDFTDRLNGILTATTDFVFNELQNSNVGYNFGREVFPATYGEDIVVGLTGGGLQFLKNKGVVNAIKESEIFDFQFKAFPNPSNDNISILCDIAGKVAIFNLLGFQVMDYHNITPQTPLEIHLQNLPQGIYLVTFVGEGGEKIVKKLVRK